MEVAFPIAVIPVGMLFYDWIVPRTMVCNPIQNDVEALFMGGVNEAAEVVFGAEFGVYAEIVFDGIGAAQSAFAIDLSDGVDGHQPEDVDAEIFESGELRLRGLERPLGGELAGVYLVENRIFCPFGVLNFDIGLRRVGFGLFCRSLR